ncbi:hypothetical protein FE257_004582 [Aspergillus nanangensis]|uniref:Transcription factor domain-containing protein n=1 Tax=Aspergillus nanangensis TaxID=2582783 RepID=A0AAD4CYA5_ASPNN|nr:hypothetical protein FE257_004582 [Aspergillus nanangensis]
MRCDGHTPCSTCYDLGVDCHYQQPSQSAQSVLVTDDPGNLHSSILDQRVQAIEKELNSLRSMDRYGAGPPLSSPRAALSEEQHTESPSQESGAHRDHLLSHGDDGVDGMGAVSLKDGGDEEEYFGERSQHPEEPTHSAGRLNTAGETTSRRQMSDSLISSNYEESNTYLSNHIDTEKSNGNRRQLHGNIFSLPSKKDADSMLHLYFSTVNLMIPCIHEDSFRQMYQSMWRSGPEHMRKPWLGSLNLIFAVANNVMTPTSPPHQRVAASSMFYERAMELVSPYMFGPLSVEMVQVFLLAEIYLEGTTSSSLVWTFHSMAVKGAYQLGLHSIVSANLSEVDCEIRRRIWYWLLSVAYGRPPLIPLSHVRLEACSSIAFSNTPSGVVSSSIAYFDALISLTHIMGGAVDQLYGQNLGFPSQGSMSESVRRISDLRWQLAQWHDSLPHVLKTITYDETLNSTPLFLEATRLRVLLSLRYLGACILVLRPILRQFLELSCEPTSSQSKWLQSHGTVLVTDLVHSCRDVLELSKKILVASREDKNLLGAWWFSCYYIVGILLIQKTFTHIPLLPIAPAEVRDMLDTAMEVLLDLDGGSKTIMRCRDTLARLLAVVDSNTFGHGMA